MEWTLFKCLHSIKKPESSCIGVCCFEKMNQTWLEIHLTNWGFIIVTASNKKREKYDNGVPEQTVDPKAAMELKIKNRDIRSNGHCEETNKSRRRRWKACFQMDCDTQTELECCTQLFILCFSLFLINFTFILPQLWKN